MIEGSVVHSSRWAAEIVRLVATQLWLSTMVAAAVWAACALLGRRALALQQSLWGLVLLRLVLPPDLSHPLGLMLPMPGFAAGPAWERGQTPSWEAGAAGVFDGLATVGGVGGSCVPWVEALLVVWGLAFVALVLWDAVGVSQCRRRLRQARPVSESSVLVRFERLRHRLAIRRRVRLVAADASVSPFTMGVLRPIVFVPETLLRPGVSSALEAALAHELAHVRRLDALWVAVERLVRRVYFFHPVAWLASARRRLGREALCDQLVVGQGLVEPPAYARGLLAILRLDLVGVRAPSVLPKNRRSDMRIRDVLGLTPLCRPRTGWALLAAGLVGVFLLPTGYATATGGQRTTRSSGGDGEDASRLENPLPGSRVSLGYGQRVRHPVTKKPFVHHGVDLAAPEGTAVIAAEAGIVTTATTEYEGREAAGTVVVIDHGEGLETYYAHLGPLAVEKGDRVLRGQRISEVGMTGLTTGPHLHFEVWSHGTHVDPFSWMSRGSE